MGADKINQILRERRSKRRKTAQYRKNRIVKRYKKNQVKEGEQNANNEDGEIDQRQKFYNDYFKESNVEKEKEIKEKQKDKQKVDHSEERVKHLKAKKKKFIKKMQHQKTRKGQPKMKNYVVYALTKIQQTLEKEKIAKKQQKAKKQISSSPS